MSGSTGRTILTVGGQILGAAFGPAGAFLGGLAGNYIGWQLFPENYVSEGPRLNELRVTTSAYGESIPIVYGGMRLAGKLIWALPLREERIEEDQGGKGGPSQTQVSYRYYATFALLLCEGPILGISRLWVDGKLVYDTGPGASVDALWSSTQWAGLFTLYPGNETQLPDPTIEAALGVGSTPAFRGTAYAVFSGLDVTDYGRIPNIEAEVISAGTALGLREVVGANYGGIPDGTTDPMIFSIVDGVVSHGLANGQRVGLYSLSGQYLGQRRRNVAERRFPSFGFSGAGRLDGMYGQWLLFDFAKLWSDLGNTSFTFGSANGRVVIQDGNRLVNVHTLFPPAEFNRGIAPCADGVHFMVFAGTTSGDVDRWYLVRWDGGSASIARQGSIAAGASFGYSFLYPIGASGQGFTSCGFLEQDLQHLWLGASNGDAVSVWRADADNVLRRVANESPAFSATVAGFVPICCFASHGLCVFIVSSQFYVYSRVISNATDSVTLGQVVTDVCTRAGYTPADLDVTALTDGIDGYAIARVTNARNALQPLQQAYFFDVVESQGKLKFVKRGGAPVATVPIDDLVLLDGVPGGDVLPATRRRATEPPRSVTVTYYAVSADYQQGAQSEDRPTGTSQQVLNVQLPLALTDNRAKQIAGVLLYDAEQQRQTRRVGLTRKWSELEGGDVITVTGGAAMLTLRLGNRADRGGLIEFEAVEEFPGVYTKISSGAPTPGAAARPAAAGPTVFELIDGPLLDDGDDYPGFYAALAGYTGGWPGGKLYRSTDGGATFDALTASTSASIIGTAVTVLGNFTGMNCFDEANSVDVEISTPATPASATLDAVLAGANVAWLAGEVIQYRSAALVGGKLFRLSGLRRGLFGTERFINAHAVGDAFVVLQRGPLRRVASSLGEIGADRTYKAVTAGSTIGAATPESFIEQGNALKPYAPVLLFAWRVPGGRDIAMRWTRRGRLSNQWNNGADVPLGEDAELYDVEMLNGSGLVVRTFADLASATATYTEAQQLADFAAAVTALTFRVYQKSARVGRGFPATATVNVPFNRGPSYPSRVLADAPQLYYRLNTTAGSEANLGALGGSGSYSTSGTPTARTARNSVGGPVGGGAGGFMAIAADTLAYAPTVGFDTGVAGNWTTLTIEIFVRPAATQPCANPSIISKSSYFASATTDFPFSMTYNLATQRVAFSVDSGNDFAGDFSLSSANNSVPPNVWTHIVAVVRPAGGLCELYINGVQVASGTAPTTMTTGSRNWKLGASPFENGGGAGQSSFNGDLAEFALYPAALSSVQVQNHFEAIGN